MSKPILSELEYNASDVASAILENADLSVTNQDFGVADCSDDFTIQTGFSESGLQAYSFNGFMFIMMSVYSASTPDNGDNIYYNSNQDKRPSEVTFMPSISYQGDSANQITFNTNGYIVVSHPYNPQGGDWNAVVNGWYRFA